LSLFAIRTQEFSRRKEWEKALKDRTKGVSVLKNPFETEFITIKADNDLMHVFDVRPLWFNFSIFGWLAGLGSLFIVGPSWFLIPSCIVGSMGLFWSPQFVRLGLRRGLRRYGYVGPIRNVKLSEVVRLTLFKKQKVTALANRIVWIGSSRNE
jgi:hypothetical protein